MKEFVLLGLFCFLLSSMAKESPPSVQVYSRVPGEMGKANFLICHVSNFHPPEITIDLLKNGVEIQEAKQTDLAFGESWHYHLTKHVPFTPNKGDTFSCLVKHLGKTTHISWDPDM
ncbi:beta-2-microglobulin isoform 1-T2 [Symphorus nematophorus]